LTSTFSIFALQIRVVVSLVFGLSAHGCCQFDPDNYQFINSMANKRKGKGKMVKMLSPENYVRTKARTLPIGECLINSSWEDSQMAGIYVVRNHSNGNVTIGVYLIDLMCLGVKNTFFLFNITKSSFQDELKKASGEEEIVPVSYELAHNIVYSGLSFAEEFGFRPHKDFTTTTRFILEEDTDAIEEIEITCGRDGKPAYMTGPYDNSARSLAIIAQLERTAGPGNYILFDVDDEFDDEDEFDEDDEFEDDEFEDDEMSVKSMEAFLRLHNKLGNMSIDERVAMLSDIDINDEELSEDQAFMISMLTNSILEDLADRDKVQQYFDEFTQLFSMEVSEVPDPETLGLSVANQHLSKALGERFNEVLDQLAQAPKNGKQMIRQFAKESGRIPAAYYLELLLLRNTSPRKFKAKLAEYSRLFPDYQLFKLMATMEMLLTEENVRSIPGYPFPREYFFSGRKHIHTTESDHFLLIHTALVNLEVNLEKMRALYLAIEELEVSTFRTKLAHTMCGMSQYQYIIQYYEDQS
jgi:hypothetical protein